MKSLKNKLKDIASQAQEDYKQQNQNSGKPNQKHRQNSYSTSNPEQVLGTMWSYFFAFWIGLFMSLFAVMVLITNQKTIFLAILILVAMPFWALFCLLMMIPDVKIFGVTVFSRRNLSLRKSVSFGRRILYTFSREFYRQNPFMATVLLVYLGLIIVAVLYAVL